MHREGMKGRPLGVSLWLAFLLVLAACTSSPRGTPNGAGEQPGGDPSSPSIVESTPSPAGAPLWSRVAAASPIVAPGETAVLGADPALSGVLTLTGPDQFGIQADMTGGRAELEIPSGAPAGEYLALVEGPEGAIGVGRVAVAGAPMLRLTADRTHVSPGDTVTVRLDAAGVPDDLQVLFGWGDIDWEAYTLDTDDGGDDGGEGDPLGVLVVDEHGLLQPGFEAAPITEITGIPLLMTGMPVASLQAMGFTPDGEQILFSEPLRLSQCAEPVAVNGDLGGPGQVHVVAFGDGLRSAGVEVESAQFTLKAPHGPLALFGVRDDGVPLDPVVLEVPCGGTANLDLVTSQLDLQTVEVPDEGPEFVEGENGMLTLSGDFEAEFGVEPVCSRKGAAIEVIFAVYDLDLPALKLTVDDGSTAGSFAGIIELTDWAAGAAQSSGTVDVGIGYSGSGIAQGAFTIDGSFDGPAGTGSVSGAFTCPVLGLTPPAGLADPAVADELLPDTLDFEPVLTGFETPDGSGTFPAAACRNVLIRDGADPRLGSGLAAALRVSLPRSAVITTSELGFLLEASESRPALTAALAFGSTAPPELVLDTEAGSSDLLLTSAAAEGEPAWSTSTPIEGVVQALTERVLCLDVPQVDGAPGEPVPVEVVVTDLAGQPLDGVTVEADPGRHGAIAPLTAASVAGRAGFTYTSGADGVERLAFRAEYANAHGSGYANARVGSRFLTVGQWRVVLNPDDDAVVPAGPLSAAVVASSCRGLSGPWDGFYAIEAGPFLALSALTAATVDGLAASSTVLPFGELAKPGIPGYVLEAIMPLFDEEGVSGVDPSRPILLALDFRLPPRGGRFTFELRGQETELRGRFTPRLRGTDMGVVSVTAGGVHLFNAPVIRTATCGDDVVKSEVRELFTDRDDEVEFPGEGESDAP